MVKRTMASFVFTKYPELVGHEDRLMELYARCSEVDREWFKHLVDEAQVIMNGDRHLPVPTRVRLGYEYVIKRMEDYFRGIDLDLAAAEYEEIMTSQELMDDK